MYLIQRCIGVSLEHPVTLPLALQPQHVLDRIIQFFQFLRIKCAWMFVLGAGSVDNICDNVQQVDDADDRVRAMGIQGETGDIVGAHEVQGIADGNRGSCGDNAGLLPGEVEARGGELGDWDGHGEEDGIRHDSFDSPFIVTALLFRNTLFFFEK